MQSDIIKEQIQELKHKQHIQRITQTKPHHYQATYSPQLTNSPYSHLSFTVKIILPTKYPEQPPKIFFVQQIHHLNIDSTTGSVKMPLLSDDWSPYLTLSAVFDSLDNLLEQPDLNYAVSTEMREQYINQPQKYLHRIQQLSNLGQSLYEQNGAQSFVQHVQIINQSKVNDFGLNKQQSIQEISHNQPEPQFQSSIISDIPKKKAISTLKDNLKVGKGNQIKIQSFSDIKEQVDQVSHILTKETNIQDHVAPFSTTNEKILSKDQNKKSEIVDKLESVNKTSIVLLQQKNLSQMDLQFSKIQQNLRRSDSLLELLLIESNCMQQGIKKCQNAHLLKILERKQQRIIQIFQETLQLSSSLRERLFQRLKTQTTRLLK